MTGHLLVDVERRPVRSAGSLFLLDWREFLLFIGILGGILALVGVIFMASFSYR